jgi:hypothetical protein
MTCTTHHHACECREYAMKGLASAAIQVSEKLLAYDSRWAPGHDALLKFASEMGLYGHPVSSAQGIDEEV